MLTHLYIRDFAIVTEISLEFGPGFTVLTGETGAGKSILVDALALALGDRAEAAQVIRSGCTRAEISAAFAVEPGAEAARWLEEKALAEAAGECLLRRVIERDKPSRGFINGRPVPIQWLRELGERLVDIHGQHEHHSLLKREVQRELLDAYAGLEESVARLRAHHRAWQEAEARLARLRREAADREARLEWLRHQVAELEALALGGPEEVANLEDEHRRLAHGVELLEGVQAAASALYDEEDSLAARLARIQHRLEGLARYDARLGEVTALISEASVQIEEAAQRLHHYLDGLELDPGRLEWVEGRIAALHDLARKHKVRAEELPEVLARLRTELGDLEDFDLNLARLEQTLAAEREAYFRLAREVSSRRRKAAAQLAAAVSREMQELGMPGGRFEVSLSTLPEGEAAAYGLERVEFLVSANAGQPLRPLAKVASGGELSRISLALEIVTARLARFPTLVFDEVDVGIGGRVAEIVGAKLRRLGATRQVIALTHLAQVAAQGERHFRVAKETAGDRVAASVSALAERERVMEIARMLGGLEINPKTVALATDMLERASAA
jgi:DNA repair protein RecN (Recombination protein N)